MRAAVLTACGSSMVRSARQGLLSQPMTELRFVQCRACMELRGICQCAVLYASPGSCAKGQVLLQLAYGKAQWPYPSFAADPIYTGLPS